MTQIILKETGTYSLGPGSDSIVATVPFGLYNPSTSPAWSGSIVVKGRALNSGAPNAQLINLPYLDVGADTIRAAGTAITTAGLYEVASNSVEVVLVYTHTDGQVTLISTPANGPSRVPAGGSGGGATEVDVQQVGGSNLTLGQKTMAESIPVVISSNQSAIAATVAGVATAANQTTQITALNQLVPATIGAAVTPNDGSDLPAPTRAVWVGGAGDLVVHMNAQSVTFTSVPAGSLLPIVVTRVLATGTTATGIVSLR